MCLQKPTSATLRNRCGSIVAGTGPRHKHDEMLIKFMRKTFLCSPYEFHSVFLLYHRQRVSLHNCHWPGQTSFAPRLGKNSHKKLTNETRWKASFAKPTKGRKVFFSRCCLHPLLLRGMLFLSVWVRVLFCLDWCGIIIIKTLRV